MDLSIIIPAYNEERRILSTLTKIIEHLKQKPFSCEILVVDDGSCDTTCEIVEKFATVHSNLTLLRSPTNQGKGSAVKRGIFAAQGDTLFFTDADLSTPIKELDRFLAEIKKVDVVIGSRSIAGANVRISEPRYREGLGKLFNLFLRLFFLPDFIDTQCGAKMFRKEVALNIFQYQKMNGYSFDVEILTIAKKLGYKILEMPITWDYSSDTRVRTFRDGFRMVFDLFKIRSIHKNLKDGKR